MSLPVFYKVRSLAGRKGFAKKQIKNKQYEVINTCNKVRSKY